MDVSPRCDSGGALFVSEVTNPARPLLRDREEPGSAYVLTERDVMNQAEHSS